MKLFVWENVYEGLTSNYHSGGGVLVIAETLESARQLLQNDGIKSDCDVFTSEPSYTASVYKTEPKVIVFQDAGCC